MAKACPICARTSAKGGGYSNRVRATKFNPTGQKRKQPNLQWAVLSDGERARICTKCLKISRQLRAA